MKTCLAVGPALVAVPYLRVWPSESAAPQSRRTACRQAAALQGSRTAQSLQLAQQGDFTGFEAQAFAGVRLHVQTSFRIDPEKETLEGWAL